MMFSSVEKVSFIAEMTNSVIPLFPCIRFRAETPPDKSAVETIFLSDFEIILTSHSNHSSDIPSTFSNKKASIVVVNSYDESILSVTTTTTMLSRRAYMQLHMLKCYGCMLTYLRDL